MTDRAGQRLLAAPILGERGGGVGQVSQLLWAVMRDEWGSQAKLVTLLRNGHAQPDAADKWRFGLELAGRHVLDRPDWILFSHIGLARVERFVPRRWSTPYAVFLHGIECWDPLPESDREILRRASLRVANSAYTAQRTSDANPDIGEVLVCPLALPHSLVVSPDPAGRAFPSRPTVLVVGRLSAGERYKGHEQLIRAWAAVVSRVPDAQLVIVGDGDDAPRLRALAAEAPVAASIEFKGFLSRAELDRAYGAATVFALPSRGEGFGLVYLEAMAHGLPCVGSIHDAAPEVIVRGETGVLVDPDDGDSMSRAICGLLENPLRAAEMGAAGRTRVLTTFSYEHFRGRIATMLRAAFPAGPNGQAH
jgi:phosphatidylinositol alpha-1,6-mannosyltransferase